MIKVEVIKPFTLEKFNELKNIERKGVDTPGLLNVGDRFECTKKMCDYLLKNNALHTEFIKVLEVAPEEKPMKKKTNKKKDK